jgi:glycosyltransferase involved in cell wall biosynthesis
MALNTMMKYRVLCITDRSDLPETELFIGLKNEGVDIEVMCNPTGKHYSRLINSEVPTMDLTLKSRFDLSGIRRIRHQLNIKPYNILFCFNNPAASNTLIASRGKKYKIITYRGVIGNMGLLSPASWTTHLHPRVNRIVCVCNAVRDYIVSMRLLWMNLSPERVVTIYKGHDLSWYQRAPADLSEFNIPSTAFVVGFAGRNRPRKGIDILINSAKCLPADVPIHFLLLGRLTDDAHLKRLIDQSPFRNNFHLPGFRNDAPAIAGACDTFVLPSLKREGLARAVIEAMAYGTPPIVTNVGGLPEMVEDQKSGIVIPPKDPKAIAYAIMDMYEHSDKKKKMGEQAKLRIQNEFNIKTTILKTKQLFEQLIF